MTETCVSSREDGQRNSAELLVIQSFFFCLAVWDGRSLPKSRQKGRLREAYGVCGGCEVTPAPRGGPGSPKGADRERPAGGAPAPRQRRSRSRPRSRGTGTAPPCPRSLLPAAAQPARETLPSGSRRAMVTPTPPCSRAGNARAGGEGFCWSTVLISDGSRWVFQAVCSTDLSQVSMRLGLTEKILRLSNLEKAREEVTKFKQMKAAKKSKSSSPTEHAWATGLDTSKHQFRSDVWITFLMLKGLFCFGW